MSTPVRDVALAVALCCVASVARAHAPLPRGLAVAPNESGALAVRMPGFGWLLGKPAPGAAAPKFEYACDALLGVSPTEVQVPMAYRADGALLAGTQHGVRMLNGAGCPTNGPALDVPIVALAVHTSVPERAYSIAAAVDQPPYVYRSDDGGESWMRTGSLDSYPVTGLVLDSNDPQKLYISQTTAAQRSQIVVSSDGGASFETFEQDRDLTLLYAQGDPVRVWATTRVVDKNVGVILLRATEADGPWQELLTVNFFGGFAVDPSDANVVWVGDEARGVYRSNNGGESFDKTQPSIGASCLAYGADALWACTLGLPNETALLRSPDAIVAFDPVMAFAGVDHMVDCAPTTDVEQVCAPAWVEWRRDILGLPPPIVDAGVLAAAGPDASTLDAGTTDTNMPEAALPTTRDAAIRSDAAVSHRNRATSGCSVAALSNTAPRPWCWLAALCALLALRGPRWWTCRTWRSRTTT